MKRQEKKKLLAVKTDLRAGGIGDWWNKAKEKIGSWWDSAKAQAAKTNEELKP